MASIHRRRKSKVWIAFFRDENRVQHGRSTGTTDRKTAQKIADQYEEVSRSNKTLRQLARVITDLHQLTRKSEQTIELVTVRTYIDRWLGSKKNEVAPSSFESYSIHLRRFLDFLGDRADRPLLEISKADITAYRDWLAKDVSSSRTNLLLNTVKALIRSAVADDLLADDVAEHVPAVRSEGKQEKRAFTLGELQAVMAVADEEWQSMIRFGLLTGQRLMDIARLRWDNVDTAAGVIRLTTQKTSKALIIPLSDTLREHVTTLDPSSEYLHPRLSRTAQSTLSHEFALLLQTCGLVAARNDAKGRRKNTNELSFHSLRHTAVSLLKDAGLPQAVVMEYVGHSSAQMSQHYTHVGIESLRKAAEALPKI
jgi:integrase